MPWKYVTSSLLLEGGANSWDLECWSLGSAALDITLEGQPSWWGGAAGKTRLEGLVESPLNRGAHYLLLDRVGAARPGRRALLRGQRCSCTKRESPLLAWEMRVGVCHSLVQ